MSSSRSGSAKRVLPPISTETDKQFLQRVDDFIDAELTRLGCPDKGPDERRYTVHKDAFDQVIEQVSAYKPLLTKIKAEYEECIEAIERGQKEAFYLSGKVKAMTSVQTTLSNYRKRGDELEEKINSVIIDNERVEAELEQIRELRRSRNQEDSERGKDTPLKKFRKRENKQLPGLTVAESTNIDALNALLSRYEQQVKELKLNKKTKFVPKEKKQALKEQLDGKISVRDKVAEKNEQYKKKNVRLKIAVDTVRAHNKRDKSYQLSLVDSLNLAQSRSTSKMSLTSQANSMQSSFEDDDPTKEREAEAMLEYIDKFNELFEEGFYAEAAMHAANSPKGILRNPGTLMRFKGLPIVAGQPSPLLLYCEALMSSVTAVNIKPTADVSWECVDCALNEDRLDLVMHWVAQDRLTYSLELGHLLSDYSRNKDPTTSDQCLALAQTVYGKLEEHRLVVLCMLRQRRYHSLIEYTQKKAHFSEDDYLALLEESPTLELAILLAKPNESGDSIISTEEAVATLIRCGRDDVALLTLQEIHAEYPSGSDFGSLKQLVFKENSSLDTWKEIISSCQENGYFDIGVELLAAVTVKDAINKAMEMTSLLKMEILQNSI
ncbi:clathrin heavy chain linker domain-containing protein 1-like [Ptychodera flava]|uniref:clathrin heavy chain linker domain-containing protein 1-like n=1 Tax=Ptychodera flava TaxID=63121 RepID=UPI003969CAF4